MNSPLFFQETKLDDKGGDISDDYPKPIHRMDFYFIT